MRWAKTFAAFVSLTVLTSFSDDLKLTAAQTRKLAIAAMPTKLVQSKSIIIERDREQNRCGVYHAYAIIKGDTPHTVTAGWWSVDLRTGVVWDDINERIVTNEQIETIQRSVRKRLGVTDREIAASLSNPCHERHGK